MKTRRKEFRFMCSTRFHIGLRHKECGLIDFLQPSNITTRPWAAQLFLADIHKRIQKKADFVG